MRRRLLVLLLTGLSALLFLGCNPTVLRSLAPSAPPPTCEELALQEADPEDLSFETVAQGIRGPWQADEPNILIATNLDNAMQVEQYLPEDEIALQQIDFDAYIAMAVFAGYEPVARFTFCVTSIQQEDQTLILRAHLIDMPGAVPAVAARYYQLLQVANSELPIGEVTFHLYLTRHEYVEVGIQRRLETTEEGIIASTTHQIP